MNFLFQILMNYLWYFFLFYQNSLILFQMHQFISWTFLIWSFSACERPLPSLLYLLNLYWFYWFFLGDYNYNLHSKYKDFCFQLHLNSHFIFEDLNFWFSFFLQVQSMKLSIFGYNFFLLFTFPWNSFSSFTLEIYFIFIFEGFPFYFSFS